MNLMVKHLQNVFAERCHSNERYSLRAFARSLDMPPSSLSEIMNEKRPMTKKLCLKIGKAFKMSQEQIAAFDTTSQGQVEIDYRQIALDSFYIISEWHHYGILQLIKTKNFKNEPKWIAQRLGIKKEQVTVAIERLIRVGILCFNKDGSLTDTSNGNTSHIKSDFTNDQLKDFQIQILNKAIHSINRHPIQIRDNTSMTMAISKKAIPFAKEEIKKFRRQLTKKLESFDTPDEVYQLAIGLNPLTNIDNN